MSIERTREAMTRHLGTIRRGRVYMEMPVLLRQLSAAPAEREAAKR